MRLLFGSLLDPRDGVEPRDGVGVSRWGLETGAGDWDRLPVRGVVLPDGVTDWRMGLADVYRGDCLPGVSPEGGFLCGVA